MIAPASPFADDIAAAFDWWREAGVDAAFNDAARGWLAEPARDDERVMPQPAGATAAIVPASVPESRLGGAAEGWPRDLPAFRQWWVAEPTIDTGGLHPRVPPSGETDADLMVLVAMPEETDSDRLFTGPEGAVLQGFLRAAGIAPDSVYNASALPCHTALPDWVELASQGLGTLIAHHAMLAKPKRLIVFGRNIWPLCGHDPAQGAQKLRWFNHGSGRIPALFETGLDRLRTSPQARAGFWKRWLEWTDGVA